MAYNSSARKYCKLIENKGEAVRHDTETFRKSTERGELIASNDAVSAFEKIFIYWHMYDFS